MVNVFTRVSANANTGAFVQVNASVNGELPCIVSGAAAFVMVHGVSNATDALAEFTANRFAVLPANFPTMIAIDPALTWVRASGAAATEVYVVRQH